MQGFLLLFIPLAVVANQVSIYICIHGLNNTRRFTLGQGTKRERGAIVVETRIFLNKSRP